MQNSSPSLVTKLPNEQELKQKLAGANGKLVVLEFVRSGSQICEYVKEERDKIAEEMKDKAEFYELDVDKFKKYAEKVKVEALPAFVVMQNFVKKRHVVGTDNLKETIDDAYTKFIRNRQQQVDTNNTGSEKRQAAAEADDTSESAEADKEQQFAPSSGGGQAGGGRRTGVAPNIKGSYLSRLLRKI